MIQENKELLLKDLCARLPYGVKILHTDWDYDHDTDFDTIETLIGIDDRFIYTVWDKTGDREKHCLSVSNWKPYLRPMSSMTEEEYVYFMSIRGMNLRSYEIQEMMSENFSHPNRIAIVNTLGRYSHKIDWLNENMFDYRGLIPKGLAIEVTKENNPYKD